MPAGAGPGRGRRGGHAPLGAAIHDLAQPAAAAALALDVALLIAAEGGPAELRERLDAAASELQRLQDMLRALSTVAQDASLPLRPVDAAAIIREALPGSVVASAPDVLSHPGLLRVALPQLCRAIHASPADCAAAPARGEAGLRLRMAGRGTPRGSLPLWLAVLRRCAARVSCRRRGDRFSLLVSLASAGTPAGSGSAVQAERPCA